MIAIKNIYVMLSYAFQVLQEQGYKDVCTESFDNTAELFAAILAKGTTMLLKRGFGRSYIAQSDELSALRGKIDLATSIKTTSLLRRRLACTYDEFSVNCKLNQILKSSLLLLLRQPIATARKKELRKLLVYFEGVDTLNLYCVDWTVQYNRNNQTYRMLIAICYLLVKGLLQTTSDGTTRLMDFLDEQRMCRLYEKFILEYYRKEHPELKVDAKQIPWQLDDDFSEMLPTMQSDIMLQQGNTVLIIDAKYYAHTVQQHFDTATLHSNNLYQIFTYVKNCDLAFGQTPHHVAGMLLYAKTDEALHPNHTYQMSGTPITVKTLDLDKDFAQIAAQLDAIVATHFPPAP